MKWMLGEGLMLVGTAHLGMGTVKYRVQLGQMIRAGWVASVPGTVGDPRTTALWFFMTGLGLVLMGWLCRWAQLASQSVPPRSFGMGLLALGLFCVVLKPASGAWALVGLGAWAAFAGT